MDFLERTTAVLLPGSGSDADFVGRAFAPIAQHCRRVVALDPAAPSVVDGYRSALTAAGADGPVLACGFSLGSAVAARWALDHPDAEIRLVLALPAWSGPAGPDAAAAVSARFTAQTVDRLGPAAAITRMQEGSPPWLARELTRSWAAHGDFLAPAMREAASFVAPTEAELTRLRAPVVVIGALDDPIHPLAVARAWSEAIPQAPLQVVQLAELGPDPAVLGRAALAGFTAAGC
ncbi:alpha/beta fold hydrolase [Tsukamurella serpentis]